MVTISLRQIDMTFYLVTLRLCLCTLEKPSVAELTLYHVIRMFWQQESAERDEYKIIA